MNFFIAFNEQLNRNIAAYKNSAELVDKCVKLFEALKKEKMETKKRMEERKRKVKIISHHRGFMVMVVMVSY